jgi:hypothetical protein
MTSLGEPPAGVGLGAFVDDLLADHDVVTEPLQSDGAQALSELLGSARLADNYVYSVLAASLQQSRSYNAVVRSLIYPGPATLGPRLDEAIAETIMVPRTGSAAPATVLLVDGLQPDDWLVTNVPGEAWATARTGQGDFRAAVARESGVNLYRQGLLIDPRLLAQAVFEASQQPMSIVVGPRPEVIATAPVADGCVRDELGGQQIASVGVVGQQLSGDLLAPRVVTTALHAVSEPAEDGLVVFGRRAEIVARDEITDSALLGFPGAVPWQELESFESRPALQAAPRFGENAVFDSAGRGQRLTTTLTGFDPSVVISQSMFATKIYTSPDTVQGDSGAALVDSDGHTMGFAAYRTAFDSAVGFAVWVWAAQVFSRHGLSVR